MRNELTLEQWNRLAEEHNLLLGEVADLRAELAAEREAQRAGMRALGAAEDFNKELMAERDALRAVLAKIRRDYSSAFMPEDAARIDAALKDDQS